MQRTLPPLKAKTQEFIAPTFAYDGSQSTVYRLTPEEKLQQFIDFAGQCYIRSGTRLTPFAPLYPCQIELIRLAIIYPGLVVCKDRQLGATEVFICYMLFCAKEDPAYASCVFSLTEKDAFKVSNRAKRMPSRIQDFVWGIDSLGIRKVDNGGELNFRPATENATRGLESIHHLLFDEAGFVKSNLISEMYAASTPSQEMVGEDARTFIISTIPKDGIDTWYWEQFESNTPEGMNPESMLELAKSGGYFNNSIGAERVEPIPGFCAWEDESGWIKIVVSHKAHPIYGADPNYLDNQRKKKKLTEEQLQREYNLTLPKAGASLFNPELVDLYATSKWEEPDPKGCYLATLDPNMAGEDFWHLLIWRIDCHPLRLVADYHENFMLPSHCRKKSHDLMDRYNVVLLVIEKNNGGLSQAEDFAQERPKLRIELVNTSGISKIINTDRIANALTDGDVRYPSDWVGIKQMKKFSKKEREGVRCPDDAVMSWAVGFAHLELALSLKPKKHYVAGTVNSANDRLNW